MAVIPPVPDGNDSFFWDGVAGGRLLIQRCSRCGVLRLPAVPMCGACHSTEWDTVQSEGRGRVLSWIVSRHPRPEVDEPARLVVLVQLDEGVRLVANLVGVEVGAGSFNDRRVELWFGEVDGVTLPQFCLVADGVRR